LIVVTGVLGIGLVLMIVGVAMEGGYPIPAEVEQETDTPAGEIIFIIGVLPWALLLSQVFFWGAVIGMFAGALWLLVGLMIGIEALYLRATRGRWVRPSLLTDEGEPAQTYSSSAPPRGPPPRAPRGDPLGHYAALGLDQRASNRLAQHAYRRQAMRHHPDRGGDLSRMQRINQAWEVIGNPKRRAAYDQGLLSI
jgi:hypothetical protein